MYGQKTDYVANRRANEINWQMSAIKYGVKELESSEIK